MSYKTTLGFFILTIIIHAWGCVSSLQKMNNQTDDERLGCCGADVSNKYFYKRYRCRHDFVDGAGKLGKEYTERRIGNTVGKQRQHHQPGHDEGSVGYAFYMLNARADRGAKYHEVKRGGNDR